MKQAEWNDITWGSSNRSIAFLKTFNLSQEVNIEEQKSNSGQSKKVVKGLNPEQLSVSYTTAFAVGIDPRGEFEMLKGCAGKQDDFILNGRIVGQNQFELDEVTLSDTLVDDSGRILKGDITLGFNTESIPSNKGGKGKKKRGKKKGAGKKSGSLSLKREILNS